VAETFILRKINLNVDCKRYMLVLEEELGS
jgi:hypothetical protein